jgi:hypothetical protein
MTRGSLTSVRVIVTTGVLTYAAICAWAARDLWFFWDEISYLRAQHIPRYELQGSLGNWLPGGRVVFRGLQTVFGNSYGGYVATNALLAGLCALLLVRLLADTARVRAATVAVVVALLTSTSTLSNVLFASETGRWMSFAVVFATLVLLRRPSIAWPTHALLGAGSVVMAGLLWLSSAIPGALLMVVFTPAEWSTRQRHIHRASALAAALGISIVGRSIASHYTPTQEPKLIGEVATATTLLADAPQILVHSAAAWWVHVATPLVPGAWLSNSWTRFAFETLVAIGWPTLGIAVVLITVVTRRARPPRGVALAGGALAVLCVGIVARGWDWLGTGPELKYGNATNPLAIAWWWWIWSILRRRTSNVATWATRVLGGLAICVVLVNVIFLPRSLKALTGQDWHMGSADQKRALRECTATNRKPLVVYPFYAHDSGEELCDLYLELED